MAQQKLSIAIVGAGMGGFERTIPGLIGLHDRVAARPNI